MSSSSAASWSQQEPVLCGCGDVPVARLSLTEGNFGRRFLGCPNWGRAPTHCNLHYWIDGHTCPRGNEAGVRVARKFARLEGELKSARERESQALASEARSKMELQNLKIVLGVSWMVFAVVFVALVVM